MSDDEFVNLFQTIGPQRTAAQLGLKTRAALARRTRIEKRTGRTIFSGTPGGGQIIRGGNTGRPAVAPGRLEAQLKNGLVIIASDCHYWPGDPSLMHRALVQFIKDMKPQIVVLNGDVVDAASISRFPMAWEHRPTVQEEIECAQDRLQEVIKAAGRARKIWTLGNHDARFETKLATVAPEFAKVAGVHLHDHFPLWERSYSVFLNDDIVIKHRFKSGIHAPHNNAMWGGRTIITGHLHSCKVMPLTDYNGTRYGVDCGTIADPEHSAFLYLEDNPRNWREGFCVLTIKNGRHLMPELVTKWDDKSVQFRGEVIHV